MKKRIRHNACRAVSMGSLLFASGLILAPASLYADGGVSFIDIAENHRAGIDYRRTESPRDAIFDALKQQEVYGPQDLPATPAKPRGNPGVAIFDFDQDGDKDVYVTNGPGTPNSLYSNQLQEISELSFLDVGVESGADATAQDSMGICYGDIDNDSDQDLYVLGSNEPNRMFENMGDGTFQNITNSSQTGGGNKTSMGCSFGDVNGDGLLDLAVGNLYNNLDHRLPLMTFDYGDLVEHNQLFLNSGDNVFDDVSEASGLQSFRGATWSIAMVDYDQDGDIDIVNADDQGTRPPAEVGGEDHGYIRIHQNDGTGQFTDVTELVGTDRFGNWMGLSFGDLNGDGNLDLFATNIGDYIAATVGPAVGLPTEPGTWSSRWFLGQKDGTFADPGIGQLGTTPFGWGTSIVDYDNDADLDIVFHGGMDMGPFVDASNPGAILQNNGFAEFDRDSKALENTTDHLRRNVQGMAAGDLNNDGFVDIVSVSNMDWPDEIPLAPFVDPSMLIGGQFDDAAFIWPTFTPLDPMEPFLGFTWNGMEPVDGSLSVEINSGDNGNGWMRIDLMGTKGLASRGQVNRDGIGAIVTFHPRGGRSVSKPVVSGGSHASADDLGLIFGMDTGSSGMIEILWPGGVRNRLYDVKVFEDVLFPEIPCSFDDRSLTFRAYKTCVDKTLHRLRKAGVLDRHQRLRFHNSAMKAFRRTHR